ncbi:MAG: GlsB/YeaQ/YmgE family stress response membrane protein [Acidobacteria bacterium]|nr:MAG: GlsB/YeaQ/YmgE family stress response membrane protein [Acidobacteriota bacterium]
MFGVLAWILFGLVVGVIAKLLMPGRDPGGFIVTIVLGIVGALIAGWLGRALGWYGQNDGAGLIASVLGAIIVLAVYRMMVGRRHVV